MWPFQRHIFLSHSSADREIVNLVVSLYEAADASTFSAPSDLIPGEAWWPQLERAILRARKVMVFWCEHSAKSQWVEREWRFAEENGKNILPVLLDSTQPPRELSCVHALDLRRSSLLKHQRKNGSFDSQSFLASNSITVGPQWNRMDRLLPFAAGVYSILLGIVRPFAAPPDISDTLLTLVNSLPFVVGAVLLLPKSPLTDVIDKRRTVRQEHIAEQLFEVVRTGVGHQVSDRADG